MTYACGCTADGDLVSPRCPIHGEPERAAPAPGPATEVLLKLFEASRDYVGEDGYWEFPVHDEYIVAFLREHGRA